MAHAGLEWLPWGILLASLMGSGHCALMCGPLTAFAVQSRVQSIQYHLGRGLSYSLLGAAVGRLGEWVLVASLNSTIQVIQALSSIVLVLVLLMISWQVWSGKAIPVGIYKNQYFNYFKNSSAGMMGFFSVLLPCGWLATYLLAALSTQSAEKGSLLLFFFWLGTVPSLVAVQFFGNQLKLQLNRFPAARKIGAILILALGVYGLIQKHRIADEQDTCPIHSPDDTDSPAQKPDAQAQ